MVQLLVRGSIFQHPVQPNKQFNNENTAEQELQTSLLLRGTPFYAASKTLVSFMTLDQPYRSTSAQDEQKQDFKQPAKHWNGRNIQQELLV